MKKDSIEPFGHSYNPQKMSYCLFTVLVNFFIVSTQMMFLPSEMSEFTFYPFTTSFSFQSTRPIGASVITWNRRARWRNRRLMLILFNTHSLVEKWAQPSWAINLPTFLPRRHFLCPSQTKHNRNFHRKLIKGKSPIMKHSPCI